MSDCLFCKIIAKELPGDFVYEDEHCVAFKDKFPKAPTHLLVVPRTHLATLFDVDETHQALMGHMTHVLPKIATQAGLSAFRTIVNAGADAGQEIFHLHFHMLGGKSNLPGF